MKLQTPFLLIIVLCSRQIIACQRPQATLSSMESANWQDERKSDLEKQHERNVKKNNKERWYNNRAYYQAIRHYAQKKRDNLMSPLTTEAKKLWLEPTHNDHNETN